MNRRTLVLGCALAAALAAFPAGPAPAADTGRLTLAECLELAAKGNNDLHAARANIERSQALLTQARSAYWPQVKLNAAYVKLNESYRFENFDMTARSPALATQMGFPADTPFTFTIEKFEVSDDKMLQSGATAEMPLFTWFTITNYNKMANRGIDISKAQLKQAQDQVQRDVVTAYKSAVLAREARGYLLETIQEMELFYKTAEQDFENGAANAPQKDVIQVQYDLDDMRTWLPVLNKWESLSLEALRVLLALDRGQPLDIVGDLLDYPTLALDLDALLRQAQEGRPEPRIVEQAREVYGYKKKVAQVSNLPMLGAFAQYNRTDDDFDANQDYNWAVGVGATMHLFDGGKSVGEYREADAEYRRYSRLLDQARKGISFQVQEAYTEVQEAYEQLKIREAARQKAIQQVGVVRQGYQYGITTVKDVNDAQVQKRWADANWLFKKLEYNQAIAKLNQVVGAEVHAFR
jgi:outer membrane protein TolC